MANVINLIKQFIIFLEGKKTYIVGVVTIALGFAHNDQQMVLSGLGMITLRAGITKVM